MGISDNHWRKWFVTETCQQWWWWCSDNNKKNVVATAEFSVDMIIINISLVYLVKTEPNLVIVIQTRHTSPPYSPPLRTPIFGWLLCGYWLVCGRLRPWCISFSFFIFAQFLPQQWYHISHAPSARRTSPPYFPLLWTPIIVWLLFELLSIGGHPKATVYFTHIFFHGLNSRPHGMVSPHTLSHPRASSPTSLPLRTQTPSSLLFFIKEQRPPNAKAPPISLIFDGSLFGAPNKRTNDGESEPDATLLPLSDRYWRHQNLGPWQVLPWR